MVVVHRHLYSIFLFAFNYFDQEIQVGSSGQDDIGIDLIKQMVGEFLDR